MSTETTATPGVGPATDVETHSRGIVSTSGLLLARRVIVTAGSAVATGVIARELTPSSFGIYSAALATFYIAQAFGDLGFGPVLARELAVRTQERPALLRATIRPAMLWSLTVAVALAVFAVTTADAVRLVCLVVLSSALALSGASVSRQWFIVNYDVRRMAFIDTVTNFTQVGCLILVAVLGGGPVELAIVVAVSTIANIVIVCVLALRQAGPARPPWALSRSLLVMSLPIGIPSVLASAYFSVDLVLAGYLVSDTEVATYAAAVKLLTLVTVLPALLVSVALPGFAAVGEAADRDALTDLVARVWQWVSVVGLPMVFALGFFAPLAIRVFFGTQYPDSAVPLRVLMGAGALALLGNIFGMLLIASRRVMATLYQNIFALVANVGLNIVLMPRYGIMAAAWLTLATEAVIVGCSLFLLRRSVRWSVILRVSRYPLLACAALAGCSFLPIDNDIIRAAVAGVAYLTVMTVCRAWPFDVAAVTRSGLARLSRKRSS